MISPLLSVIIPTYHRNDLLRLCLDQLKPESQTLNAAMYEVIVSDDGTSENAEAMVKADYPWVKWFQGPKKGPAANRNNGAKNAKGKWLVFTDDDCIPDSNWLKAFYDAICDFPKIQVFEGKTICKIGIKSPLETAPINETGGYLWSCNFAISKALFEELEGFNEGFPFAHMEDVHFREKILFYGYSFPFVKEAIIDHPPRLHSSTHTISKQHESEYFYYVVLQKLSIKVFVKRLFMNIIRARYNNIRSKRISIDSVVAFANLFLELIYTLSYVPKWRKKYRRYDLDCKI